MLRLFVIILKNILIFPWAFWKLCYYAKHTDDYPWQEKWDHIHNIMSRAIRSANVDLTVTGLENLPTDRPFMIYSNHQGMFDVMAISGTCPIPLAVVYKKELKGVPLLQQIYDCTRSYPMDREDVRQSLTVIQNVTEELKQGRSFVIFPEGTRSRKGNEMLPFHGGSFRCALKAKCPIVPMAFIDSFKVLDEKGSDRVAVQLHYLPVIEYEEFKDMKTVELAALVKERIATCMADHIK